MDITKVNGQLVFTHTNGTILTVNSYGLESPKVHARVCDFVKSDEQISEFDNNLKKESRLFIPLFYSRASNRSDKELLAIDKLFPFVDMLDCTFDIYSLIGCGFPLERFPKGFAEFCKRERLSIKQSSYINFLFYELTKNLSPRYRSILREVHDHRMCMVLVNHFRETEDLILFAKAFINSTKKPNEVIHITEILDELNELCYDNELDETKTLKENANRMKTEAREQESSEIRKAQSPFLFLEKIEHHGLRVVIPLSLEELEDEGSQQSNCVGEYYNEMIVGEECFIYFIRKEDKLEKSYITCRYDLYEEKTEEARARFNKEYKDERVDEIICMVDEAMEDWE